MFRNSTLILGIGLALHCATSRAAELAEMFSVHGYSTLAGTYSDVEGADYVSGNPLVATEGVGESGNFSVGPDSRAGVQFDMRFTERLSGVVQLISEGVYNSSWDDEASEAWVPSLEWANLSYRVTDAVTLRAGRIVLPFLMFSDSKKIGYANYWVHAPTEVYSKIPFNNSDGVDVTWRRNLGSSINKARVYWGKNTMRRPMNDVNKVESWGITDTWEAGNLTLRAAYLDAKFTGTPIISTASLATYRGRWNEKARPRICAAGPR